MDSPPHRFSLVQLPARSIALLTLLLLMLPARSQDAQQILWHLPSEETPLVIGRSYPLEGSASSGLPVVYRVAKGPATITDGRVMATNVGTIVVVAEQPGNGAFLPASLSRTFNRSVIETERVGQLDPAAKVRVANGLVYLAGQDLAIVRVTDPQSPQVLGRLPLNSPATDVEVEGSYAVLTSADGLLVVDVGDPRQPRLLTTTSTSGPALAVSLELPTVAVATGTTGVDIFTWLPPAAPQRITTLDSGENPLNAQSLLLHHHIAYVANFARSVHVYDLSNPSQPLSVGEIAGFGGLAALAAAGPHLHVLDPVAYWVFQLQPPALPFQVGSGSSAQDWFELVLSGDRAFAVGNQYGFRAFDLVDSIHPWLVGETGFDFFPVGLDLQGNLAFVTFGAQPTQIRRLREGLRQPVGFQIHDVHVTNGPITFTLTATAASGLPATFRLLEGPAVISGSELTVTNAGMLVVQADVPGNEQFYPASVTATFFAYKLPQDVRFEPPASVTLGSGGLDLFLFAEASSGLPVDFEVLSGPGRIEGGRLMVTDVGTVRIRAWQPGDLAYYESPTVERTILVTDPPSFTRQPSPANVSAGSPVTLQAAVATPAASTFQWYLDGVAVPGATLAHLELPSVTPARTGLYHLVATHAGRGSATSSIVSVSVDLPGSEVVLRPRGSLPLRGRPNRANPARIELQDHYAFVTDLQLPDLRIYDVGNPEGLQQVATLPFLGPSHEDSALKDGFLYLAERLNGLAIVDVRNPRRPVRHSLYRLPGNRTEVVTIEIRGELAYVGNGAHGLAILNLSNPTQPVLVGSLDTSGLGAGVRLRDDLAYVADWSGGLKVVNVADPTNPFLMTRHPGTDSAGQSYYDLFLNDRAAYVADTAGGLLVLDLAGFPTLRRVGLIPGSIWGLDGGGRLLATADNSTSGATPRAGIRLFDIATPTNAIPLGRFADWGTMDGVRLQGNRLFVAGTRFGIIDLDFPTRPPEITEAPVAISGRLQQPARLEVRAQGAEPLTYQWFHGAEPVPGATNSVLHFYALQIADGGSYVVEVRNPLGTARSDPVRVALQQEIEWTTLPPDKVLRIQQPHALAASSSSRLPVHFRVLGGPAFILEGQLVITNVGRVRVVAEQDGNDTFLPASFEKNFNLPAVQLVPRGESLSLPAGGAVQMALQDSHLYLANGFGGLVIYDIADPRRPVRQGFLPTADAAFWVDVSGPLVCLTDTLEGLVVIDVSDPQAPVRRATVALSEPGPVRLVGSLAYVGTGTDLLIVDLTHPGTPSVLARLPVGGAITDVRVQGNRAYLTGDSMYYRVVNVADPRNPQLVFSEPSAHRSEVIHFANDLAFIADRGSRLTVYRVTGSDALEPLSSVEVPILFARGLDVVGNRLYAAVGESGWQVYDIADPRNPQLIGAELTTAASVDVRARGTTAFVANGSLGLLVFDVSSPGNPVEVGAFPTSVTARSVQVAGDWAFLADGSDGLQILDVSDPDQPRRRGSLATLDERGPGTSGVDLVGGRVAVADGLAGLQVVDVQAPEQPRRLGGLDLKSNVLHTRVSEDLALVVAGAAPTQVRVVRWSDSAPPAPLAVIQASQSVNDVQLSGDQAYIVTWDGLERYDLSRPGLPVLRSKWAPPGVNRGGALAVVGQQGYWAVQGLGQLLVLDLSDPAQVRERGRVPLGDNPYRVVADEDLVFVAGLDGMSVFEVANPSHPRLAGQLTAFGRIRDVAVADGRAYLASRGLHIFDVRVGSPQSVLGDLPVELPAELFPFPLPGVADSGLPVRYSVTEGPAVVDGPVLRLTGLGTVTLRAQQDGDLQFLPLDEVRSFLVTGPPVIEVGELSGGRIQLSWPLSAGSYSLEYSVAPGLDGATWSLVGDPVEVVGEQIRVRTSVEDSATRWFRLRRN